MILALSSKKGHDFYLKRLRLSWYSQGNKAGKHLAQQYKRRAAQTKIPFLLNQEGHKLTNPKDIANEFSAFYSKLYNLSLSTSEPHPTPQLIQDFLTPLQLPSITPKQLNSLAQPFSHQENLKAIKELPIHKAPGPDGYINEYYKTYTDQIIPHLCNTFNRFLSTGEIPPEFLEAVITTIHKPGKSPMTQPIIAPFLYSTPTSNSIQNY